MSPLWQTVLGILASLGGGGVIVLALSSWLGKLWAQRFLIKETAELKEKEERLIKRLEQKNYVSKVRFDAEFAVYRDLCVFTDIMVRKSYLLFPEFLDFLPASPEEMMKIYENRQQEAAIAFKQSTENLAKNAAFIPEEQFLLFDDIHTSCMEQLHAYMQMVNCVKNHTTFSEEEHKRCVARAKKIEKDYTDLVRKLRVYLKTLDVEPGI